MSDATPSAGFVVKLTAPDGQRHYVNIGSHAVIDRPLQPDDREVDDAHLRTRGLENLRVPLLTGEARTVLLTNDEEAVCIDVVFNPAVLAVALAGVGEDPTDEDDTKPRLRRGVGKNGDIDPDLAKFVRVRLVELALKNAEEDLGYKIGRNYTLPRGVSYRGGVGGGKQPVPMANLRKLAAALAHEKAAKATAAAPGPWRSKRDAAGLANTAKIEEIGGYDSAAASKPLLKKGFLNSGKSKGAIYPEGSSEGMLYGDVKVAGDPLGYLPKGLRSKVNVVDQSNTTPEQQEKIMQDWADGKGVPKAHAPLNKGGGGGYGANGHAKGGGSGGNGVAKGFLNGKGGSLYPDASGESASGGGGDEMEALKQLVGDKGEMEKMIKDTDPEQFMSDLQAFGNLLGGDLGDINQMAMDAVNPMREASSSMPKRRAAEALPEPLGPQLPPKPPASSIAVDIADAQARAAALAAEAEPAPDYSLEELDGSVTLKVQLPQLSALGDTQVDISDECFELLAPGMYKLGFEWPRSGVADEAKAKFNKKSRTLTVTMPLVV